MKRIKLPEGFEYVSEILFFRNDLALILCEHHEDYGSVWQYFNPKTGEEKSYHDEKQKGKSA